jgi:hypothetical protein
VKPPPPKLKLKLKPFVDRNQKLLSVFGVFAALVIFAQQMEVGVLGGALQVMLLTCFVVLGIELIRQFPRHSELPLTVFQLSLQVAMAVLTVYWVLRMESWYGHMVLFGPLFAWTGGVLFAFLRRRLRQGIERGWGSWKLVSMAVAIIVLVTGWGVALSKLTASVYPPVHKGFDFVRDRLDLMPAAMPDTTAVDAHDEEDE